jgi:DNA-binding beta-propeller fold protein YncE
VSCFCGCKKNAEEKIKKVFVSTIAGTGDAGIKDGPALSALFRNPWDVAVLPDGSIYVADYSNHRLRKITARAEVVNVAGDGGQDTINGKGTAARFKSISLIAADAAALLRT